MSENSFAFVRTEEIQPSPPPMSEAGLLRWLRKNLFSSVGNSILTFLSFLALFLILKGAVPWLLNGVWNTASLAECREVLDGRTGACFSVISERWSQFLYGLSYPNDQYWRPNLAFLFMIIAILPVLFFDLPRKMLIFTAIYPFLAFWLIWGGAFWLPLLIMAGFALAYFGYSVAMRLYGDGMALFTGFAVIVLWFALGLGGISGLIDRAVGSARMEAKATALDVQLRETPERINSLERQIVELEAQVKDVMSDGVTSDTASQAYPLRKELRNLRGEMGRLGTDLSDAENLRARVSGLDVLEAELPEKTEKANALRDALPDTVSDVLSADALKVLEERNSEENLGIPPEDFAAAEVAILAEKQVADDTRNIRRTYSDVALIGLEPVSSRKLGGFMLNMMLGVTCVSLSLPLGIALALGRQSSMPLIRGISVIFIEFIRGVPLITLLFVASVMLSYFFPPGSTVDLFLRVVIMITLFSAAYIAEVIRGGLAALPKGQYEAADSLGLDYPQAMRLIILPQALKISIPGIVNVAVGLFKDTTLVSVISMFDIIGFIRGPLASATEWNGVYWEPLLFACVLFFTICYGISQYSQWLERRLATDHR